jgi:hypothetical protein
MAKLGELLTEHEHQKAKNLISIDLNKEIEELTVKELQNLTYILVSEQEINASKEIKVSDISRNILNNRAKNI